MASSRQQRAVGEPRSPEIARTLERIDPDRFVRHSHWEEVLLVDPDLALIEAIEPRITTIRVEGGDLGDAKLVHLTLEDAELLRVSATNVKAESAVLRRVRFDEARLTGTNLGQAELYDVAFDGVRLDYATFNRARLIDVRFSRCDLREVDFTGARLDRVRFESCDLSLAEFQGAEFKRCEMVGCTLDGAKAVAALRGIAMPIGDILAAAPAFAAALGIIELRSPGD